MLERYDSARHKPMLDAWARARELGPDAGPPSFLPPVGFVADECACAFLFQTDSAQAYVGAILSSPDVPPERRGRALDAVIAAVCTEARERGFKAIAGLPTVHALAVRFHKHGFTTLPGHFAIRRV